MNFSKLTDFIDSMASTKRSPGNAAVVYYKGQKVFSHAAGFASLEEGTPFTGKEYVNIYSCSKVATVTAAAQLLERGLFLLNDPLYEYIPEFRHMSIRLPDGTLTEAKNPIRVGHLFSMTAGLNYNCDSPSIRKVKAETSGKCDTLTLVKELANEPLSFEPGTRWQYSLCHDVLAGLVYAISGMPFREYMKKNIFEPLGMDKTVYHHTPEIEAAMAEQYRFAPDGGAMSDDIVEAQKYGKADSGTFVNVGKQVSHIFGEEYDSGGAGITTTVDDYAKLLAALAGNGLGLTGERILSPATVNLMKTNRLNAEQLKDFSWEALQGFGYGLGVHTHIDPAKSGSNANLGAFGWGGAAGASALVDSSIGLAIFFVQHCLNPREQWYQPRLRNIVNACID